MWTSFASGARTGSMEMVWVCLVLGRITGDGGVGPCKFFLIITLNATLFNWSLKRSRLASRTKKHEVCWVDGWAGKGAYPKPYSLSSSPRLHRVQGKNRLGQADLWPPHLYHSIRAHARKMNRKWFFLRKQEPTPWCLQETHLASQDAHKLGV